MKVLIMCDHYPLSPRVLKMRNSILKSKQIIDVKVLCWNRKNIRVVEDYVITHKNKLGYGNFIKSAFGLLGFMKAAKNHIKTYKPDYIHAIDLPMLLSAYINKEVSEIIYEVYDIKTFKNPIINKIRETIEMFIINKEVDKLIYASPYFQHYYKKRLKNNKLCVNINNKPNKDVQLTKTNFMGKHKTRLQNKMVIAFVGSIRHKEILLNLIYSVEQIDNVVILLAGDGIAGEEIKRKIGDKNLSGKVIFTGRFGVDDLREIYENCHYIWAAYPNRNLNVRYAVSNKFYEAIVFNTKIIVSENTHLSNDVKLNNLGYVVNPYSRASIKKLVLNLKKVYFHDILDFKGVYFWEDEEQLLSKVYRYKS